VLYYQSSQKQFSTFNPVSCQDVSRHLHQETKTYRITAYVVINHQQ